jgi:hypothetical protein
MLSRLRLPPPLITCKNTPDKTGPTSIGQASPTRYTSGRSRLALRRR